MPDTKILLLFVNLLSLRKKATIHQVTTMLETSKNVLFPGHSHPANHRYWLPDTLIIVQAPANEVKGHQ